MTRTCCCWGSEAGLIFSDSRVRGRGEGLGMFFTWELVSIGPLVVTTGNKEMTSLIVL